MARNLHIGDNVLLAGTALTFGYEWEPFPPDLDCGAVAIATDGTATTACFAERECADGAIRHLGDNLVSGGASEYEFTVVDFARLGIAYDRVLLFAMNVFAGNRIDKVDRIRMSVYAYGSADCLHTCYADVDEGNANALVLAEVRRSPSGWVMTPVMRLVSAAFILDVGAAYLAAYSD